MKSALSISLLLLLVACNGNSGDNSNSQTYLGPETAITTINRQYQLPGVIGTVIKDQVADTLVSGVRKFGANNLIESNDKFHLGSCTKAMTATLAAILIEEGILSWKSELGELLPDINLHGGFRQVTFDMLLAHRSGLRTDTDQFPGDWMYGELQKSKYSPSGAREFYAKAVLVEAPTYTPGSRFHYSNGGYMIAAHIMEKLTGQSWENLIREKLFQPLNMTSCGFGSAANKSLPIPNEPWGHWRTHTNLYPSLFDNPTAFAPAAGVHCNMHDWGKFLQIHLDGFNERPTFLSQDSFNKLHTVYPANGSDYTYGGWIRLERNWADGPVLTHNGTNTLNYARVWLAPKKNLAVMAVTNAGGDKTDEATSKIVGIMLDRNL